jgi:hypothetical protein
MSNARAALKSTGLGFHTSRLHKIGKVLTDVKDDDLVIISGHGQINSSSISCKGKHGWVELTANDLAEQLQDQGLPKTHQSILMGSCEGGGTSEFTGATGGELSSAESLLSQRKQKYRVSADALVIGDNKAGECFASILAKALGLSGYRSILVGGWPGGFSLGYHGGSWIATESEKRVLAQLDHIQWYDAWGNHT